MGSADAQRQHIEGDQPLDALAVMQQMASTREVQEPADQVRANVVSLFEAVEAGE